ncbi:Electron transfer flavoprotein alpha-subunit [Acidilobus saccharovorans 345-15]|uniref:Electron transfer flavoprotein alpha-subunit n=1 Tax=Acidilobus saccharovorans (strain DSM 16705 / JCM 18335 / VKM B-2471 / 345-15) TaxID=666510 RepID=D9Q033_ACIS3|nr:electron transfer flavoprotein subunit alpha/FixB family protein [Acidilobus saccharovorans]ADL18671.1 Electron transfer flavoprotein alpha-subunit [Acidilobus saccharovorans 345-15]
MSQWTAPPSAGSQDCDKLCPEWECRDNSEYRGVWVIGEVDENGIIEPSLQMLTPAKKVASKLNVKITGVLLGSNVKRFANQFIEYGADEVIVVDDPRLSSYAPNVYGEVAVSLIKKYKPEMVFVAGTMKGRELAPYIANHLRAGITADCTDFDVDEKTRDVFQIRPPFGAVLLAYIRTPNRRPQLATARPNVFPLPQRDPSREGEIIEEKVDYVPQPKARLVSRKVVPRTEVPIEKAELVIGGGKGLGTAEGFKMLQELANAMGAVVGGSRKAVDLGWIPHERQIGQTGKSLKSVIYMAVGISGAAQHMFGVREAEVVVAINKDPTAPIFSQCDYGVVADYREVIPHLIKMLKDLKEQVKRGETPRVE